MHRVRMVEGEVSTAPAMRTEEEAASRVAVASESRFDSRVADLSGCVRMRLTAKISMYCLIRGWHLPCSSDQTQLAAAWTE